jgi:WD40 repeat protein
MRLFKKYELAGVPLVLDQGKCTENSFYVGSFKSNLSILDLRMAKAASEFVLNTDAITCVTDSINDQNAIAVGDRAGNASIIDLKTKKIRVTWTAHSAKGHLSKPRGVVNIIEDSENEWITIGCNDKSLKLWEITKV